MRTRNLSLGLRQIVLARREVLPFDGRTNRRLRAAAAHGTPEIGGDVILAGCGRTQRCNAFAFTFEHRPARHIVDCTARGRRPHPVASARSVTTRAIAGTISGACAPAGRSATASPHLVSMEFFSPIPGVFARSRDLAGLAPLHFASALSARWRTSISLSPYRYVPLVADASDDESSASVASLAELCCTLSYR